MHLGALSADAAKVLDAQRTKHASKNCLLELVRNRHTLVPFSPMTPRSSMRSAANMPRRLVFSVDAWPSEPRSLLPPTWLDSPSQLSAPATVPFSQTNPAVTCSMQIQNVVMLMKVKARGTRGRMGTAVFWATAVVAHLCFADSGLAVPRLHRHLAILTPRGLRRARPLLEALLPLRHCPCAPWSPAVGPGLAFVSRQANRHALRHCMHGTGAAWNGTMQRQTVHCLVQT